MTPEEYELARKLDNIIGQDRVLRAAVVALIDSAVAAQKERDAAIAESFIPSGFRGNETLHEGTYHKLPLGDIVGIARDDRARVIAAAIRSQS